MGKNEGESSRKSYPPLPRVPGTHEGFFFRIGSETLNSEGFIPMPVSAEKK
jgi:hypothetical protein